MEKKNEGVPVITPSHPSGLADARSSLATDQALQAADAPAHTPQFGDVFMFGARPVVILREVGDGLYLTADENGNRHYFRPQP